MEVTYIKRCPSCGMYNEVSKTRARNTKLSTENLYICECGKKYIEYRYFMNEDSKGRRTNAMKVQRINIKSKKSDRVISALKMRDGSVAIMKDGKLKYPDKKSFTEC